MLKILCSDNRQKQSLPKIVNMAKQMSRKNSKRMAMWKEMPNDGQIEAAGVEERVIQVEFGDLKRFSGIT